MHPTPTPPKRSSFFKDHWQAIAATVIGGLILAVMGAVLTGAASWMGDAIKELFDEDPPSGIIGNWKFDSFEPEEPPPPMTGTSYEYTTLQLRDDETFTIAGKLIIFGEQSMMFGDSGDFEMTDSETIRFISRTEEGRFWEFDIKVTGDTLRLTDTTVGVTHVFNRN